MLYDWKEYMCNIHSHQFLRSLQYTVEPPNKGHFWDTASVLISEVVLFSEVRNVLVLW